MVLSGYHIVQFPREKVTWKSIERGSYDLSLTQTVNPVLRN